MCKCSTVFSWFVHQGLAFSVLIQPYIQVKLCKLLRCFIAVTYCFPSEVFYSHSGRSRELLRTWGIVQISQIGKGWLESSMNPSAYATGLGDVCFTFFLETKNLWRIWLWDPASCWVLFSTTGQNTSPKSSYLLAGCGEQLKLEIKHLYRAKARPALRTLGESQVHSLFQLWDQRKPETS